VTELSIESLPPASGADSALVAELTDLVNDVYASAEAGLWRDDSARTDRTEVAQLIRAGEIALARLGGDVVGAVRIQRLDQRTGELGMLVANPGNRNRGIGRALVDHAERRCASSGCSTMQLELLMPLTWSHPTKDFLAAWYERLGYRVVRRASTDEIIPTLAHLLATPCDFAVYHKSLARAGDLGQRQRHR
jgi:ribosomal protein S18 acetylase RimI-like enzyme